MKKELLSIMAVFLAIGSAQTMSAQTDVTAQYLQNPDFEGTYEVQTNPSSDRAIYKPEGWTVTLNPVNENDMSILKTTDLASNNFTGGFTVNDEATRGEQTYWFRYRWGAKQTLKLSQSIENLPAGMYRLTADVVNYSQNYNYTVMIYAGQYAQSRAAVSTSKGDNWNTVSCDFYVEEDGDIEVGFSATNGEAAERIFGVDNFKLYRLEAEEPTVDNPVDMTGYIVNPCFDFGSLDGWTSTTGAQNRTIAQNKGGAITGKFYENWNGSPYSGTIEQTINNLPLGVYTLRLAAFRSGGSGNTYVFANEDMTLITTDDGAWYEVETNVTDGTLTFGVKSVDNGCNWTGVDNASLTYKGASLAFYTDQLAQLRETATNLKNSENAMSSLCRSALEEALAATESVEENVEALNAAILLLSKVINAANTSIASYMIFSNGTIATDVLDNWNCTTGNTFHINTWSKEGETDGSNMVTPFLENWVGNGNLLNNGIITYTLENMEPGMEYTATALVRVLNENGEATTGLSMFANAESLVIEGGEACNKGFYGTYSVSGIVGEDGVLKLGFEIQNATFNWVAIKNLTVAPSVVPVVYDLIPTNDPADGSVVDVLEGKLTFPIEYTEVDEDKQWEVVVVNKDNTEETYPVMIEYPSGKVFNVWTWGAVDMTTYQAVTAPGTYELIIPAGVFGDKDWYEGKGGHANPELRYTYTIVPATVYDLVPTNDPADGSVVDVLEGKLTFPIEYTEVDEDKQWEVVVVNKDNTEETYPVMIEYPSGKVFNVWTWGAVDMTTYQAVTAPGTYELIIPAGVFGDKDWYEGKGGHANPELRYTYTIVPATVYDFVPTVNPEEGVVENLDILTFTCPDDVYMNETDEELNAQVKIYNKETKEEGGCFLDNDSGDYTILYMIIDPTFAVAGNTYVIEIPEGLFGDKAWDKGKGGHANPALKYEYTLTTPDGIAETIAETAQVDVYTLNGVLVLKAAGREALKTLKKGIYVIDGKKVILQ